MKTIGSVESYTGGKFAAEIVDKPGASKYYRGSLILYATDLKGKFGVDISNGVINKEVALMMSKIGREELGVDICVSFTGNAGPGETEGKPTGLVFIAINDEVFELQLDGDRNDIQNKSIEYAKNKLWKIYQVKI